MRVTKGHRQQTNIRSSANNSMCEKLIFSIRAKNASKKQNSNDHITIRSSLNDSSINLDFELRKIVPPWLPEFLKFSSHLHLESFLFVNHLLFFISDIQSSESSTPFQSSHESYINPFHIFIVRTVPCSEPRVSQWSTIRRRSSTTMSSRAEAAVAALITLSWNPPAPRDIISVAIYQSWVDPG